MSKFTRQDTVCPSFGQPKLLNPNCLPSIAGILRSSFQVRYDMAIASNSPGKDVSFSAVADLVAKAVETCNSKASIPTVTHNRVV